MKRNLIIIFFAAIAIFLGFNTQKTYAGWCDCYQDDPMPSCYTGPNNGQCCPYCVSSNSCPTGHSGGGWSGDCGGGGGGGGTCTNNYQAAALTDAYTVGSCTINITHLGWDQSDNQPVGYRDLGAGTRARRVAVNDSGATCKNDTNLDFTNDWNASSGRNFSITTTINAKNAGNNLAAGWQLNASGCTINDTSTTQIGPANIVSNSGSGLRQYTLYYCGDGICSINENSSSCLADCPVPTQLPTAVPTAVPTPIPTSIPTIIPTPTSTPVPTQLPTAVPTAVPTPIPTSIPTIIPTPTSTPVPTPEPYTVSYKVGESPNDLVQAVSQSYTTHPLTLSYTFKDKTPGVKTLFIEFTDSEGNKERRQQNITLLPSAPEVTSISCIYDSTTGIGTVAKINGTNFGEQGNKGEVRIDNTKATIQSWTDEFATPSASGAAVVSQSRVVAKVNDRLEGSIQVEVTLDDGRKVASTCGINTTTVVFEVAPQCAPAKNYTLSDVMVTIYEAEATKGASKRRVFNEKIKIDSKGGPIGFSPKLFEGNKYVMLIKAPRSVTQKVEFTAEEGTTKISTLELPIGNIGSNHGGPADDRIDTFDVSKLYNQWSLIQDIDSIGDFNSDKRVNSIDYSCMMRNWGKEDEEL